MRKLLLGLLFALGVSYWGWGQILTFEFSALAGSEVSAVSNTNDVNLTTSTITRGAGLTASNNGGRFNATSWALTSIANAVSGDDYMEITITPNSGYQFEVSSIYVQLQRSSTGPSGIALRSSVDNYATNLDMEYAIIDNTSTQNFTFTFTQSNSSTPVTYRFYMWAEAITGSGGIGDGAGDDLVVYGTTSSLGGNVSPSISTIIQTPAEAILSSSTVSVSADVTDSDGTVSGVELHWGLSPAFGTTIAMDNGGSGDTYTTVTDIPAQANGATVYYEVYAIDDDGDFNTSPEQSYSVVDPASTTLPYAETFDAGLGDCYPNSVSGDTKYWIWNAGGYAYMSGFNSGETEQDWLVIPGINLDNYSNEFMTFDTWYQYGTDDENNYLKLYYSSDYVGVGNPTSATWTELPYTQPGASQSWASSGFVDLRGISGTMVYIAFKYNYQAGSYRNWGLDNISIMEYNLIDWANLQWPEVGSITVGTTFTVYAQAWEDGVTNFPGQGAGITAWIGYSTTDTDPSTWTDWVLAPYFGEVGNNDEYSLDLGLEILSAGTYYYASRFQLGTAPFQYGGFQGGFWDGVNNVSGVLTVNPPSAQIDWANLQWPPSGTITIGGDYLVYAQVYEPGVTDLVGQGPDITAWIGYSTTDTDPSTWTDWVPANFNTDAGINDEYMANIGIEVTTTGTVYYVSRFKLGLADYVYGGYNASGGGFWDGVNNVSGVLTVNAPVVMINEVDADTDGTDVLEFIELYDGGVGNTSLTGLVIVLYNGNGDVSYNAFDLDGYSTDVNGYFLMGNTAVVPAPAYTFPSNTLQNGADAIGLYIGNATDFPNGTVVTDVDLLDALVYDTGDADVPGLIDVLTPGQPQIDEQGRGNGNFHSNQRIPNGSGGLRITSTYDQSPPTPGAVNVGIYTDWTGAFDADWHNAGNWHNGVPNDMLNAEIPDVSGGKAPYPIISGSATVGSLFMATGSTLEIASSGDLTVIGTFTNNGTLNIKSDATGTGSLIESNGVAANVERYLTPSKWHYVSSPVTSLMSDVFVGLYLMEWDEPTETWTFIVDLGVNLNTNMYGYAVWADAASTVYMSGSLNAGANSIGVTNNVDPAIGSSGFNFVGNPYPSGVDWDVNDGSGWTRTNVSNSIYIWSQDDGNYGVYVKNGVGSFGVTNEIPPHQGFFVYCDDDAGPGAGSGTLAIDNGARIHTNQEILKGEKEVSDYLKFRVTGNNYSDEFILGINNGSSVNYDSQFDAQKLNGSDDAPQMYSMSNDGERLSINMLPEISSNMTIPVGFSAGVDAIYVLTLNEVNGFDGIPLYLEDKVNNIVVDIKSMLKYKFFGSPDDITDRFVLHFSYNDAPGSNDIQSGDNIMVFSSNKVVNILSNEEITGDVIIYDMLGQEVIADKLNNTVNHEISMSGKSGYFIVNIVSDRGVMNKKIYLTK